MSRGCATYPSLCFIIEQGGKGRGLYLEAIPAFSRLVLKGSVIALCAPVTERASAGYQKVIKLVVELSCIRTNSPSESRLLPVLVPPELFNLGRACLLPRTHAAHLQPCPPVAPLGEGGTEHQPGRVHTTLQQTRLGHPAPTSATLPLSLEAETVMVGSSPSCPID